MLKEYDIIPGLVSEIAHLSFEMLFKYFGVGFVAKYIELCFY